MKYVLNLKDKAGCIRTGYEEILEGDTRREVVSDYLEFHKIHTDENLTVEDIDCEEDEEKFYVWGTGAVSSPLQCLFEKYAAENSSAAANYTLNNKKLDFSNADDWAVEINCPEGELDEASRFDDAVAGYESIPPGKRKEEEK